MSPHICLTNRRKLAADCNGIANRRNLHLRPHKRSSRIVRRRRSGLLRKNWRNTNMKLEGKIRAGIKRLREEMTDISEDQKCIREGQRQVRDKFEKIQAEREHLWKETELISKQNAGIRMKLGLMFGIVKARAQNNSHLTAQLTQSLRDLVDKKDEQMD